MGHAFDGVGSGAMHTERHVLHLNSDGAGKYSSFALDMFLSIKYERRCKRLFNG